MREEVKHVCSNAILILPDPCQTAERARIKERALISVQLPF